MNPFQDNPFRDRSPLYDPRAFWGRQKELEVIRSRLMSELPQCCAVVGETHIGKSALLRYLAPPPGAPTREVGIREKLTFVYLDARRYIEQAEDGDKASVRFWSDLYHVLQVTLKVGKTQPLSTHGRNDDQDPIDAAFKIYLELKELIQAHQYPVVFVLDNFEGIAKLPLRDSSWLRDLVLGSDTIGRVAYLVAARHLVSLLYHPESWEDPSPLWNLFPEPIRLGLLDEKEAMNFILQGGKLESFWSQDDLNFVKGLAGRHPELIRLTCARLYDLRQQVKDRPFKPEEYQSIEFDIYRDTSPVCNKLWIGLADPELMGRPRPEGYSAVIGCLSPFQQALMAVAQERNVTDEEVRGWRFPQSWRARNVLAVLEQCGLLEHRGGKWHVFAEAMCRFIREQIDEEAGTEILPFSVGARDAREMPTQGRLGADKGIAPQARRREAPAFTYLEGEVYEYLRSHAGEVCNKEEIKRAVWKDDLPSDSALQKVIERIRKKIDSDSIIAVRGQGFMFRKDSYAA